MRVAIIGANGHWAYALNELKNHTLVGLLPGFPGEDMSSVARTLKDKGISADVLSSFEELNAGQPEIVIVNTRFDLNGVFTERCLKNGWYVFSEKPLALSEEQLERIKEAQKDSFVVAMFGITWESWCRTIKKNVEKIGTVCMINGRKSYKLGTRPDFYYRKETFGGLLPWVGIHAMHWISDVTGLAFTSVTAQASPIFGPGNIETVATAQFTMANGAVATVTADYHRPSGAETHDDDRLRVVGSKGILEYEKGVVTLLDEQGCHILEQEPTEDIFRHFVRRISDGKSGISPEESIYLTHVALTAQKAAETGQKQMI